MFDHGAKTYDEDNINLEEDHFARMQHYNLRSNPNFQEEIYVDDWFVAIEEDVTSYIYIELSFT